MDQELDRFVDDLKSRISLEMKSAYGDEAFHRWMEPLYMGTMDGADAHGSVASGCGDLMEIFLRFEGERVVEAKFRTSGCGTTVACGSFAAELALGKTAGELLSIMGETILGKMGELPAQERHCAYLAAEAVQRASMDYMARTESGS